MTWVKHIQITNWYLKNIGHINRRLVKSSIPYLQQYMLINNMQNFLKLQSCQREKGRLQFPSDVNFVKVVFKLRYHMWDRDLTV